jgi:hypothetical protein
MKNIHREKAVELMNLINGKKITLEEWESTSLYAKKDIERKVEIIIKEVQKEISMFYGGENISYCKERHLFYDKVLIELNNLIK